MDKTELEESLKEDIQFDKRKGLVPTIVQDDESGEVLMLAYVNREALLETKRSGYATFWSTSRDELWKKGETSGEYLLVNDILTDCDQDALIYKVKCLGSGACHTKNENGEPRSSCFYRRFSDKGLEFIEGLE